MKLKKESTLINKYVNCSYLATRGYARRAGAQSDDEPASDDDVDDALATPAHHSTELVIITILKYLMLQVKRNNHIIISMGPSWTSRTLSNYIRFDTHSEK